jgi:sugar lactone lactonase YvrE
MRELLARGVAAAPVDKGLGFALTITGGGSGILAGPWMLRIPGAPKPLQLLFEGAKLESGTLEAVARIRNVSGAFAGGLRLDLLEIAEGAPGPEGAPARVTGPGKSRPLGLDSPLYFGDLAAGADAAVPFRVGPLGLTPGSPFAVVRGIVTGAVAAGTVEIPDSSVPVALDSDGEGRVYVGDSGGQAIFRLGPEASSQRKIPAGCVVTGVAVRKKSGELYASCSDTTSLLRLPLNGKLTRTEEIGRALGPIRFGGKGFLYGSSGSPSQALVRLEGLSIKEEIASAAGQPLHAAGFDVDPDGTIWTVTSAPEGKLLRIRSARDIFAAAGPGNGLGGIASPRTCRVAPDGGIYVLESASTERPARVDVFDRSGNLLRGWSLPAGDPIDLAFGTEGRLLVLAKRESGRGAAVTVFRVF